MIEIIPAINVDNFEELKKRVGLVEPYVKWIHLDVADGTFTPNSIWHNAKDLFGLETFLNIEVHLMIADMDKRIDDWLLPNIKRVIFHLEAAHDPHFVADRIKNSDKKAGLAIIPQTLWQKTEPFWDKADIIQILGVDPGIAGQEMKKGIVEKIKDLHSACPSCIIEADGGVNSDNASDLIIAGASILVSASAIFGQDDIGKAIKNLKNGSFS